MKEDSEEKEQFDPRTILANLPPLPALEAFNKHRQAADFLANSQNLLAGLGGHGRIPFTSASVLGLPMPPHTTFSPIPPARPPSQPTTPSSQQSSSPVSHTQQNFSSQQNWSFEEQFKQVREFNSFFSFDDFEVKKKQLRMRICNEIPSWQLLGFCFVFSKIISAKKGLNIPSPRSFFGFHWVIFSTCYLCMKWAVA